MKSLNNLQRSRLKLTLVAAAFLMVLAVFPMWIIYLAAGSGIFQLAAPWIYLGTIVTTIGLVFGYYINKESSRPSLFSTVFNSPVKRILKGEDETDPEDIPL